MLLSLYYYVFSLLLDDVEYEAIQKSLVDVVEPAEILCVIGCEDMLVGSSKD